MPSLPSWSALISSLPFPVTLQFGGEALDDDEADEIIDIIDTNGDKKIHYDEFIAAMEESHWDESDSDPEDDH